MRAHVTFYVTPVMQRQPFVPPPSLRSTSSGTGIETTPAQGQGGRRGRRPEGYRWLSVLLPQQTFNHLHIQARLSDLSFQEYMARFCKEAFPYPGKGCVGDHLNRHRAGPKDECRRAA